MLRIRNNQFDALRKVRLDQFFRRVVAHIRRNNPKYVAENGETGASALAEQGYEMSRRYAITAERDVVRLIDLMVVLGPDFDVSPEYPWAKEILENHALSPANRIDELWKSSENWDPEDSAAL